MFFLEMIVCVSTKSTVNGHVWSMHSQLHVCSTCTFHYTFAICLLSKLSSYNLSKGRENKLGGESLCTLHACIQKRFWDLPESLLTFIFFIVKYDCVRE